MKTFFENSDSLAIRRRSFLQRGALAVAGAAGLSALPAEKARACMECLTEKLDGTYPIGKTTLVGDQVIPVSGSGPAEV